MVKKRPALYVIGTTRWDREGIRSAHQTQVASVFMMDELLGYLKQHPGYSIVLDGQTILAEDYLTIRSEQEEAVRAAVSSGQLIVGPWYVLPNLLVCSPEAILRNLHIGMGFERDRTSASTAYLPEAHGYVSQLPQILSGFGIKELVLSDPNLSTGVVFDWVSQEGSEILTVNLDMVDLPQVKDSDALKKWIENRTGDHGEAETATLVALAAGQGLMIWPRQGWNWMREAMVLGNSANVSWIHIGKAAEHILIDKGVARPKYAGNLRSFLNEGDLTGRMPMKLRNHQVEVILETLAEPFSALATLVDLQSEQTLFHDKGSVNDVLSYAWKTLLQSQGHATLSGHTSDQAYREAMLRIDKAEEMAEALVEQAFAKLAQSISTSTPSEASIIAPITVFNGAASQRTDLVSLPIRKLEQLNAVQLQDISGVSVPFELADSSEDEDAHILRFLARDIPAFGYSTFFLRHHEAQEHAQIKDAGFDIENEFIAVSLDPSIGTLSLFDKRTGRSFSGLNHFVDGGDAGSLTRYKEPENDTIIEIATNTPLHVERVVSDIDATLSFLQIYRLPRQLAQNRRARLPLAAQFVPVAINTTLRLPVGLARVDFEITISNNALDHRLCVEFPVGSDITRILADGHFQITDWSAQVNAELDSIPRSKAITIPQRSFVSLCGADTGLTIASQGLPEITFGRDQAGIIASLTLLRAVGTLLSDFQSDISDSRTRQLTTPLGQLLGDFKFRYSLIPHAGDLLQAWHEAWACHTPLRAVVTDIHTGSLLPRMGLIEVANPEFVVSAIKLADDGNGIILRGFSISAKTLSVRMHLNVSVRKVSRVTLDEVDLDEPILISRNGDIKIKVRPSEIVTLRLE